MNSNTFKTTVLLAGIGGLLVLVGSFFGRSGAVVGMVLAFVMVGGSYWFSDKLAIRSARAVPATEDEMPEYYRIVRELTDRAGMPMPKLYVTPDMQPNAFATGRSPNHAAVAVTRGILEVCDWDELRGVLAHELSHVGNRDILIGSIAAAVGTAISFIAQMAMFGAMFGGSDDDDEGGGGIFGTLILALIAPMVAGLMQAALSRSREFQADASGARLVGDGDALARALQKLEAGARRIPMAVQPAQAQKYIVNPLTGRKVKLMNFSTHPSTEDRVAKLRAGDWR